MFLYINMMIVTVDQSISQSINIRLFDGMISQLIKRNCDLHCTPRMF